MVHEDARRVPQFPIFLDSDTHSQGPPAGYTSGLRQSHFHTDSAKKLDEKNECVISSSLERRDYCLKGNTVPACQPETKERSLGQVVI